MTNKARFLTSVMFVVTLVSFCEKTKSVLLNFAACVTVVAGLLGLRHPPFGREDRLDLLTILPIETSLEPLEHNGLLFVPL